MGIWLVVDNDLIVNFSLSFPSVQHVICIIKVMPIICGYVSILFHNATTCSYPGFSESFALFFVRRHGIVNITATTDNESERFVFQVLTVDNFCYQF